MIAIGDYRGAGRARISEFRKEGSPVETVRRGLPKRAGGPKHHDAVLRKRTAARSAGLTRAAKDYVSRSAKRIVLIDGEEL